MKFLITQESKYLDKYEVEAETEDQAKELVLSGTIELLETEYIESDCDSNNMAVFTIEPAPAS
jgi:hypothetical protein